MFIIRCENKQFAGSVFYREEPTLERANHYIKNSVSSVRICTIFSEHKEEPVPEDQMNIFVQHLMKITNLTEHEATEAWVMAASVWDTESPKHAARQFAVIHRLA